MVRALWSGGVRWGPATPARAGGVWQPGATPTGTPLPDVAIEGTLVPELQSASWGLGINGFLDDLAASSATFVFIGSVVAESGDHLTLSHEGGVLWIGRVDTVRDVRDTAGNHVTTITATDLIGGLAGTDLYEFSPSLTGSLIQWAAEASDEASLPLTITDASSGLPLLDWTGTTFSGSVLAFINNAARVSNAMLALQRDGSILAVMRESVTPSDQLALTGDTAPATWALHTSIDVDINTLVQVPSGQDDADVALYGVRAYETRGFDMFPDGLSWAHFADWAAYGASHRPTADGEFLVRDAGSALLGLQPFAWVTEDGKDWQVLSVRHEVTVGQPWRISITADDLLDLL